jgi:hypothetical protein
MPPILSNAKTNLEFKAKIMFQLYRVTNAFEYKDLIAVATTPPAGWSRRYVSILGENVTSQLEN